jgi:hypothetical protein
VAVTVDEEKNAGLLGREVVVARVSWVQAHKNFEAGWPVDSK